jgi:hypothetical protein
MKNAQSRDGDGRFFGKLEAERLPRNQYTAWFQAIPCKLMKGLEIGFVIV